MKCLFLFSFVFFPPSHDARYSSNCCGVSESKEQRKGAVHKWESSYKPHQHVSRCPDATVKEYLSPSARPGMHACHRNPSSRAPRQTASQKTAISPAQQTIRKQQDPKEKKERKKERIWIQCQAQQRKKCKERNDCCWCDAFQTLIRTLIWSSLSRCGSIGAIHTRPVSGFDSGACFASQQRKAIACRAPPRTTSS